MKKIFQNLSIKKIITKDLSKISNIQKEFHYLQSKCVIKNIKNQLDIDQVLPFDKRLDFAYKKNNSNNQDYFRPQSSKDMEREYLILMYDGIILQKLYQEILSTMGLEFNLSILYIIITDKLICSFDEIDWKYHARSIICGNPTFISTSGLRFGPARPKDYYLKLIYYSQEPEIVKKLENEYIGKFIEKNDDRINSIIEGLAIQSIHYLREGDSFCNDPACRLFNSHWQEEILSLNLNKNICKKHLEIIKNYNSRIIP